jgi:hypothetical protein
LAPELVFFLIFNFRTGVATPEVEMVFRGFALREGDVNEELERIIVRSISTRAGETPNSFAICSGVGTGF